MVYHRTAKRVLHVAHAHSHLEELVASKDGKFAVAIVLPIVTEKGSGGEG
jgi:hypothetical protein